jgi:response regulator RpfG family c-di-GMP phosphodiesterase
VDIFELAKQAKEAKARGKDASQDDSAKVIARLERKLAREKSARLTAEKTIEESSRNLYLSNRTLDATIEQLETTVLELNETMARLTSAEVKRLATTITLILAAILFFVSEFAIEPVLERSIDDRLQLALAKVSIFSVLIPIEILVSRYIESNLSEAEHLNEDMYRNLLEAAYDDGIITDMERTLLDSSSKQLGLTPDEAKRLEDEVAAAYAA